MPAGPRGGPVFDAAGRLMGLVMASESALAGSPDRIVPVSLLAQALAGTAGRAALVELGNPAPAGASPPAAADMSYETSLKATLQVITAP